MDEQLSKYIVLVPLSHNDGTPVDKKVIRNFQDKIYELGGGFTVAGTAKGAYRMSDGKKHVDHSLQYWICISADKAEALTEITSQLGSTLGQESMYFESTGGSVSFILPTEGDKEM